MGYSRQWPQKLEWTHKFRQVDFASAVISPLQTKEKGRKNLSNFPHFTQSPFSRQKNYFRVAKSKSKCRFSAFQVERKFKKKYRDSFKFCLSYKTFCSIIISMVYKFFVVIHFIAEIKYVVLNKAQKIIKHKVKWQHCIAFYFVVQLVSEKNAARWREGQNHTRAEGGWGEPPMSDKILA